MRTFLRGALAPLAVALTACAPGGDAANDVTITVDSSSGVTVVRSTGSAPTWRAELVTTIGADSGDAATFGGVRSLLLDSAGGVTVLDPSFVQVTRFDSAGRLVRRIGRKGTGPGEYVMPYSLARIGGSMFLLDPGIPRIMRTDLDGAWSGQWTVPRISGGPVVRLYRIPPDGFATLGIRPRESGGSERLYVGYGEDGPRDTLVALQMPMASGSSMTCDRPDGGITFFSQPFGPLPHAIPGAGGVQYTALSSEYRIIVRGPAGDTLRIVERPVTPAPVGDAEWEAALEEVRAFRREWPTARCDRDGWERPLTKPPLRWMFLDDEGQLWVETLTATGLVYDVFGPDGALRATVTGLPASDEVDPSVVNGRIALAPKGTDDLRSVQVYRLAR